MMVRTDSSTSRFSISDIVDPAALSQDGLSKVLTFLSDLKRGLDEGRPVIELDIPFLLNENQNKNEYLLPLELDQTTPHPEVKEISLLKVVQILEEIVTWTEEVGFPDNALVKMTLNQEVFSTSLLDLQADINENWLREKPQMSLIENKVDLLLELYSELVLPDEPIALLVSLIQEIEELDPDKVLEYWSEIPDKNISIKLIIQAFYDLPVGQNRLPSVAGVSVNQVCLLANSYKQRLINICEELDDPKVQQVLKADLRIITDSSLLFDAGDENRPKNTSDDSRLKIYLITIDRMIESLLDPEKAISQQRVAQTQSSIGRKEPEQRIIGSVPSGGDAVTSDVPHSYSPASVSDRSVYRYQSISVHAGFLYNHVVSNIFTLYGLPPGQLPPLLEYQLRHEIVTYLYALDQNQLRQLNSFGRLALGESLFRDLILRNPKIFVSIEKVIQTTAASQGQELLTVDPLHVEDRTAGFNHEQFIRDIPQTTEQLEHTDAQTSLDRLTKSTTAEQYNLGLKQSDESFKAGLLALGIEGVRAENIRQLILAYIQTTGLDPAYLLANRSPAEISALFDGVNLDQSQINAFILLVESYWQYQMQKMQMTTGHQVVPQAQRVIQSATGALETTDVVSIVEEGHSFAESAISEGNRDIRLYTIASLSTSAQLRNPTYLRSLAESLRAIYNDDQAQVDQAVQTIISIHQAQIESLRTQIATNLSHRQLVTLQSDLAQNESATAEEKEPIKKVVPDSLSAFNALSLQEKELLVEQLLAQHTNQDSPQQLFASTDYSWQNDAVASMGYANAYLADSEPSFSDEASELGDVQDLGASEPQQIIITQGQTAATKPQPLKSLFDRFKEKTKPASEVTKTVSRSKSVGSSLTQMKQVAAKSPNPVSNLANRLVGGATRAIFGKDVGDKVDQLIQNVGLISTLGSALSALGGFLLGTALPFIVANLPAILLGAGVTGAIGGIASFLNSSLIQPVIGTPPLVPPAGAATGTATGAASGTATATTAQGLSASATATATPSAAAATGGLGNFSTASMGTVATTAAIGGTVVVTAVATISAHSAFLSPLEVSLQPNEQSRFLSLTKEASPSSFENEVTDKTVNYTITITPKPKEDGSGNYRIRVTQITDTFQTLGQIEGQSQDPADLASPVAIGYQGLTGDYFDAPITLTYSQNMTGAIDVLVQNTVEIDYEVEGEDTSTTPNLKSTASVRIGDPQTGCFEFADTRATPLVDGGPKTTKPWTEGDKNFILEAYLRRAGSNASFNSLVCQGGNIKLYRLVEQVSYGGFRASSNELAFYDTSFNWGLSSVEYTLIHELGHIIDDRNPEKAPAFRASGYSTATAGSNTPCFTYPLGCNSREAFAEGIALFVVHSGYTFSTTWSGIYPFSSRNPSEYNWFRDNIFNGQEYL